MVRRVNLRQIEIFKALIEHGTVIRAAEVLHVSQPAASKLLMQLENENDLRLFDRYKGRLVPTTQGLRLYDEIDRIFASVRQVESAISFIRREDQGRLVVGVIPALAGTFIQRATMDLLRRRPSVYFEIESMSSQWIAEHVVTRDLDVGLVSARVENPYLVTETLSKHPLLCIMPKGHPLTKLRVVKPGDLNDVPFVSFKADTYTGRIIANLLEEHNVRANVVLTADASPTVCQFVAAGLGISLVHPLFVMGSTDQVVARPFESGPSFDFLLCFARDARNAHLIADFVEGARAVASDWFNELRRGWT